MHSRRGFLTGLACGCMAASTPFAAAPVFAEGSLPNTSISADQALAMLKDGNAAFIKGLCQQTGAPDRIKELTKGQSPFAVIVGCSDSRTPPGELFNRGLGELFVTRVAGNTVDTTGLGSIEYGVGVLGAPLVVVLGHTQCGAVEAAVKMVREKATFPGAIGKMVAPIVPAVQGLKGNSDLVGRATRANVQRVAAQLRGARPIIAKGVKNGKVKVVGAIYNMDSGVVDFMAEA